MSLVTQEGVGKDENLAAVIAAAQEATADIALITDAAQAIIHVSASFTAMTGYEQADLLGRDCRVMQGAGTDEGTKRRMKEVLASEEIFEGRVLNYRKDGSAFWTALKIVPMRMNAGSGVTHFVSVQRDISNKVALLEQLQHQALHDLVTGLPNRTAAERFIDEAVQSPPYRDETVAVGLIDLDDFRLVNNTLGHAAGDAVLQQWSARVLAHLRDGDVLARMGGDEFLLILKSITRGTANEDLRTRLATIHQAVEDPFTVEGQEVSVGMSLGIALVPEDGTEPRSLLRSADEALYVVKRRGNSRSAWWKTANHSITPTPGTAYGRDGMDDTTKHGNNPDGFRGHETGTGSVGDYRSALTTGDVVLHLQPVVDLRDGSVHLFEALARLKLPSGRIALPVEFLPHFGAADQWTLFVTVLDQALGVLAAWDQEGIRHDISVNLPPSVLLEDGTLALVQKLLHTHDVEPSRLGLELLESDVIDLEVQRTALGELVHMGVNLAMDDLGSGYSSLQRLSSFPFSAIKLDRGLFLHARDKPLDTLSVMATLIQLGRDLDKPVVIEGLEDESLTEAATILGAPLGQGYYLAGPMSPGECLQWVGSFTLNSHRSPIRTPLGALAYHWQFARLAAPHPLELDRCPLTRFIHDAGAPADVTAWHARQHAHPGMHPGMHPAYSRSLIEWLTHRIHHYVPEQPLCAAAGTS